MEEWLIKIGQNALDGFLQQPDSVIGIMMLIYTLSFAIIVFLFTGLIIKTYYKMFRSLFKKKKVKHVNLLENTYDDIVHGNWD